MHKIIKGTFHYESKTETAGTAITQLVQPKQRTKTRITELDYRSSTTAHTVTVLKPVASGLTAAAAAAGQKDISLTPTNLQLVSGEALAANDYIAWVNEDGTVDFDLIASVNTTTGVVTMTNNLPTAVLKGAKVWAFHEVGRSSHFALTPAASATSRFSAPTSGIVSSDGRYEPLLVHSNNATAAGVIEMIAGYYAAI